MVHFTGLEPVVDLVAGPLTVNATNGNNAINVGRTGGGNGLVSVDGFETIEFANKTTLTVNALAGSDTISVNNPAGLSGDIIVNGGDPTGSDRLIVNGTTGQDTATIRPTDIDSGSVSVPGLPTVNFDTIESVTYDGQGGDDELIVQTPGYTDIITLTPGAADDAGRLDILHYTPPSTDLVVITYEDLGSSGQLTLDDTPVVGIKYEDALYYRGTDADDWFDASAGADNGEIFLNSFDFVVSTPGIAQVTLEGLGGTDSFGVYGGAGLLPWNCVVEGGDGTDNVWLGGNDVDVLTLWRVGDDNVHATGSGLTIVDMRGIESIDAVNWDAGITINGIDAGTTYNVTPTTESGRDSDGGDFARNPCPNDFDVPGQ